MNAREELRLRVFELLLRNGYSLNNPVPFKAALDAIEAMVLGGPATAEDADPTGAEDTDPTEAETSRGNPAGAPEPAKAGKGRK